MITPASREAGHDSNGATGQADDVVSDGADQMADQTSRLQPVESWQVGPAQEPAVHNPFSAPPLGVPGEVLQVLRIGMHDVEMVGSGIENGLLRTGRQSPAEPVLGLSLVSLRLDMLTASCRGSNTSGRMASLLNAIRMSLHHRDGLRVGNRTCRIRMPGSGLGPLHAPSRNRGRTAGRSWTLATLPVRCIGNPNRHSWPAAAHTRTRSFAGIPPLGERGSRRTTVPAFGFPIS